MATTLVDVIVVIESKKFNIVSAHYHLSSFFYVNMTDCMRSQMMHDVNVINFRYNKHCNIESYCHECFKCLSFRVLIRPTKKDISQINKTSREKKI